MGGKLKKELAYELVVFALCICLIVLFWRHVIFLTGCLVVLYAIGNRFWHKKHDYVFFVIGAILGPMAEVVCIYFRVWSYSNPTFLGIPLWLPFAWGIAALMITRIAETFVKIEKL